MRLRGEIVCTFVQGGFTRGGQTTYLKGNDCDCEHMVPETQRHNLRRRQGSTSRQSLRMTAKQVKASFL